MAEHTLGTAYVQIVPSANGISGSISKVLGGEADSAGSSAGSTIASKIKGAIAAAGIGVALKKSIMQGAALEQSLGGIETLFKEHADTVIKNASNAYKTTGLSANAYMEQATSFAASLLQSVGGNTEEAARLTDMALVDMADNANKMGTSMDSITNAYQGFAKQNYTMLDNLKLGYGGTKTEMQRLLADATKLTGIKYDINNLSDVYSAIHVIQGELKITGTTALEAEATLSGSFASMKAAAQDLLGNIALGRDVGPSMAALAKTGCTFFFDNLIPAVTNIIKSLPVMIYTLITEGAPMFVTTGITMIKEMATGLINGIPEMLNSLEDLINEFVTYLTDNGPIILKTGGELIGELAGGIVNNIPAIIGAVAKIGSSIISGLVNLVPTLIKSGLNLVSGLVKGITDGSGLIKSIIEKVKSFFNITLSFKGIKLPHIEMSWKKTGIIAEAAKLLGIPGVPKFDVKWYKTGGLFDNPSIIGVGEAGTEAVVPLDQLWNKLDAFIGKKVTVNSVDERVTGSIDALADKLINALSNVTVEHTTTLDGRTVAKGLAPFIDRNLGRSALYAERGL